MRTALSQLDRSSRERRYDRLVPNQLFTTCLTYQASGHATSIHPVVQLCRTRVECSCRLDRGQWNDDSAGTRSSHKLTECVCSGRPKKPEVINNLLDYLKSANALLSKRPRLTNRVDQHAANGRVALRSSAIRWRHGRREHNKIETTRFCALARSSSSSGPFQALGRPGDNLTSESKGSAERATWGLIVVICWARLRR